MTRPGGQLPAEILDAGQHAAALGDRIHAELRLRAVRGVTGDVDLEPGEALVRDAHLERRSARSRSRRRPAASRRRPACRCSRTPRRRPPTTVTSPASSSRAASRARPQRSGRAALHVEAAAAVEAVALDARLERALVAVVPDRVGVPVEQQRAPAAAAARDADHVGAAGRDLVDAHLDARAPRATRRRSGRSRARRRRRARGRG